MNVANTQSTDRRLNLNLTDEDMALKDDPKMTRDINLSNQDLERIRNFLGQGLSGYARQGDIVELHKRIGEKFATLPEELAEHVAKHNAPFSERLDCLEASLNSLEAALRIELPPMLSGVITRSVKDASPRPRARWGALKWAFVLGMGLVGGVVFHAELAGFATQVATHIQSSTGLGN